MPEGPSATKKPMNPSDRLLRWYGPYALVLLAYWAAARLAGAEPAIGTSVSAVLGLRIIPDLCAAYVVGRLIVAVTKERTFRGLGRELRRDLWNARTAERLAGIALFVLGTVFMFDVFGAFKQAIPDLGRYVWDAPLARIDAVLHLGRDPWRWSWALPGRSAVTWLLDRVYVSWYAVLIASVLIVATWAPLPLRARFFLSLVASCIVAGTLLAILLASGGPVYYAELTGGGARFVPLLDLLEGTRAREGQRILWEFFETRSEKLYGGVSAMPSMHVALTWLVTLALWSWARWAGLLAGVYTALILVGSVHLGWHYAIDGYMGIAVVGGVWWGVGKSVEWPRTERILESYGHPPGNRLGQSGHGLVQTGPLPAKRSCPHIGYPL